MFTFERRDEGYLAVRLSDGRPVAHIDTREVGWTNDPRLRQQEQIVTALPRERWRVHFTAARPTLVELEALVRELAAQE